MSIKKRHVIEAARGLASDSGENTEYDRALVELAATLIGERSLLADDFEEVELIVLGRSSVTGPDALVDETLAPEQVEKLAHEWALSHGIHSYDDVNNDIMEQFSITFDMAEQITEFLDAHAATVTLTFGPVA